MRQTHVKDLMTANPEYISANATLKEAAEMMAAINCGVLPVGSAEDVQGIVTDRDIVIRAVAKGVDVSREKVKDYMTPGACCCAEEDTTEQAAELMNRHNVNRLLVKDRTGQMSGILTFGRILREEEDPQEITSVIECAVGRKAA